MGAEYSSLEDPGADRSALLTLRVLRVKGEDGQGSYGSSSPLHLARLQGRLPRIGEWASSQEAVDVLNSLEEAVKDMPVPTRTLALDLLGFHALEGIEESAHVRTRRAYGDTAALNAFDPQWHAPEDWCEDDDSCEPSAVVLQGTFVKKPKGKDKERYTLVLRTLVTGALGLCPHEEYKRAAFGRLPLAIDPPQQPGQDAPPCVAVSLDGQWLSSSGLAVLPEAKRARIKASLVAQLLVALRSCIETQWAGGFCMLRQRVLPLLSPDVQVDVDKLATVLALARTGGEPTTLSRSIRAHHAELLRAQGKSVEAVLLERAIALEAMRYPLSCCAKPVEELDEELPDGHEPPLVATLICLGCM